ncbi:NAD(P)-dependent oxidoreductase [Nocardia blacklockiae]|uniref:NAD(P)-dependent oxidoreductase n=1 Tax=Nocardia blacklockiae TaxID=480036 RepID=UPI0018956622|nr:NAD(P)H-binding protein [Nocardia blacklockiae]MBF6173879.1 NAD(P)H-binding protein [Nocardia blacklockiae]
MAKIIVFGAGGRAGRTIAAEARSRGHAVTLVVRDAAKHPDLDAATGDVTDAARIAELAAGHDVAVHAAATLDTPAAEFFPAAVRALLTGLATAGVPRLVAIGLATSLPTATGVLLRDAVELPAEHRDFLLGHGAGTDALRSADTAIDWTVVAPSGDFDHTGDPVGRYRVAPADFDQRITYPDFARAVVDEIERPAHTRAFFAVTAA